MKSNCNTWILESAESAQEAQAVITDSIILIYIPAKEYTW